MRDLRFRLWDKDYMHGKRMEYFNLGDYQPPSALRECPIMQFTGLHDKNGKEIWEGDLLRNGADCWPAEVKFVDGMFVVGNYRCELYRFSGDTKEVLGNIYENPELLK